MAENENKNNENTEVNEVNNVNNENAEIKNDEGSKVNETTQVNPEDSNNNPTVNAQTETSSNTVNTSNTNNTNNDGSKTEKKKSNTGLIVTIIILAIIIVALIGGGIFLLVSGTLKDLLGNSNTIDTADTVNEVETTNTEAENPNLSDLLGNTNTMNNENTNSINTNSVDNNTTVTGSNGTARTSSLENPLQVGEWGIASKYNTNTSSNQNVNIKVTNIIRGDGAKAMAQEYMSSDYSIYEYEEPEAYLEWVVIEYDVDFADTYIPGELGASPNVNATISGPDGSSVKYNGITYITSTLEIGSRDYIQTKTGSGKILTQIPIGCTDYIVQFGVYNGTTAYFQGK